ncbi:shikimate kinase, partial [Agromyces binzhouensis]
ADLAGLAVVRLDVSPEAVAPRLTGGTRPLLADGGLERWTRIREERRPLYDEVAGLSIDTTRRSVARIVAEITEWAGGRA